MGLLPVQEGGRVMPLQTWANFTMLRLSQVRGARDANDRFLPAVEVVMDAMARPEWARRHSVFLVKTWEILDALGLEQGEHKKRGRDRYAYDDLAPARDRLGDLAERYGAKKRDSQEDVEAAVVDLAHGVVTFESLVLQTAFAREGLPVPAAARPLFGGRDAVPFSEAVARLGQVFAWKAEDPADAERARAAETFAAQVKRVGSAGHLFAFLPPTATSAEQPAWLSVADLAARAAEGLPVAREHVEVLAAVERWVAAADEPAAGARATTDLVDRVRALAQARGEYEKVPLEVHLTNLDPFQYSLFGYALVFLLVAVSWVVRKRWLYRLGVGLTAACLAYHVYGIVLRCVLRERPPITTLYETTLFVAAFGVLMSLVLEAFSRRGIALAFAPLVGAIGLFVAGRYEVIKGEDTMPQLVAVLDTNFWLATHVTCIVIGYASAMLASAIAHLRLLGPVFGWGRKDPDAFRGVDRMIYGTLAFSLIFSVVGTILGGIWANDSWGRFWGWDPKENGALLICLAQLATIHGRLGGYLKGFGIAVAQILTGCVVAFSWWGVNLLGVGLHAYGFTGGLWNAIFLFYGVEGAVIVGAMIHRQLTAADAAASPRT
jgi:ABC-type transport system involved in cytochrome c biogenesis permease subunit